MAVWQGHFSDGRTAERHAVQVILAGEALLVQRPDGERVAQWALRDAALCEEVYADGPVRLRHRQAPDARLTVEGPGFAHALATQAPHLGRRRVRGSAGRRIVVWGALLIAVVGGMFWGVPRLAAPIAALIPVEWEEQLGHRVVAGLVDADSRCATPEAQAALDRLTGALTAGRGLPYRFQVSLVNSEEVNAFAAPGGQIVVFSGLIDSASSGEELAGVLAHEIAHVVLRHPTEGLVRSVGFSLAVGAVFGDFAGVGATLGELGATLLDLAHSRDAEHAADALGVELLRGAGLDSRGLSGFFARLQEDAPELPRELRLLSTHPLHADRVAAVAALAGPGRPAFSEPEWQALRAACPPA